MPTKTLVDQDVDVDLWERLLGDPSPEPHAPAAAAPAPTAPAAPPQPYAQYPPPFGQYPYGSRPALVARPKRPVKLIVLGVLTAIALIAGVVAVAVVVQKPSWDSRVEPLARFVEQARGGEFDQPVTVEFHSPVEFDGLMEADPDVDATEAADEAHWIGTLRALGMISGELDTAAAGESLSDQTLGYFSPEDGRIHLRGEVLDPATRVTLVHELTHAYDFQNFDLDLGDSATTGEELAHRAVVEGSAMVVENEYIESLSELDSEEYWAMVEKGTGGAPAVSDAVPPIFAEGWSMPYVFGPIFIEAVAARIGARDLGDAIDHVMRRLPKTEEHLARPDRYVAGDVLTDVPAPKLGKGETDNDQGSDMGQLSLAMMLAPRLGAEQAWNSVDGWAGDNMTAYSKKVDGKSVDCARVAVVFDTAAQAATFHGATGAWAAAIPGATTTLDGVRVDLAGCDPGPGGTEVAATFPTVTDVASLAHSFINVYVDRGASLDEAICSYDRLVSTSGGVSGLVDKGYALDDAQDDAAAEEYFTLVESAAEGCAVG